MIELRLVLQLIIAHLLSDFILQPQKSEYVLVGTLLSFGIAIFLGIFIGFLK